MLYYWNIGLALVTVIAIYNIRILSLTIFSDERVISNIPTAGKPHISAKEYIKQKESSLSPHSKSMHIQKRSKEKGNSEYNAIVKYLQSTHKNFTIRFAPRPGSGFGNHFRAIRGLLLVSIINNANFCVIYDDYFDIMDNSLAILRCKINETMTQWDQKMTLDQMKKRKCNYYFSKSTEIATSDDLTKQFVKCPKFLSDLMKHITLNRNINVRKYVSRYLFQPKHYIVDYAKSILNNMNGVKVGIQLRFGGSTAAEKEWREFLDPSKMDDVIRQIKRRLNNIQRNYSIFVSSDTPVAVSMLSPLNKQLITANKYSIGHTKLSNTQFMVRALTDIYVLSHCDILFITIDSTYGALAKDLSYGSSFHVLRTK